MKKILKNKDFAAFFGMFIGSTLYCFGVIFILKLGDFYASGVTGTSQLITVILEKVTGIDLSYLLSLFIGLFNIPLFLIGWKGVSKKFAILSLSSVVIQVFSNLLFQYLFNAGFNPFSSIKDNRLLLAIIGGLVMGISQGISLRVGASTGGLDIISQYLSFKKKTPFGKISFTINFIIISIGGLLNGLETAIFTIFVLIITILVLDKVHTVYNFVKISIVTEEKTRMREVLITKFNHGVTIFQAVGGYTNSPKYVLETIVSSYEIAEYRNLAKKIDPNCFISYAAIKGIDGQFNQNAVA